MVALALKKVCCVRKHSHPQNQKRYLLIVRPGLSNNRIRSWFALLSPRSGSTRSGSGLDSKATNIDPTPLCRPDPVVQRTPLCSAVVQRFLGRLDFFVRGFLALHTNSYFLSIAQDEMSFSVVSKLLIVVVTRRVTRKEEELRMQR